MLFLNNAIYYSILKSSGAEVLYMNMSAYNEGRLQSSFWIVDKQHVYIGSASLDWRSLGQVIKLKKSSYTHWRYNEEKKSNVLRAASSDG